MKSNSILTPKSELPWTSLEAWSRIIIYYILILGFLLSLQLSFGQVIYKLFESDANVYYIIANTLASIIGVLGIVLTLIFLKFDDRNFAQLGLFIPSNFKKLGIFSIIVTVLALFIAYVIEITAGVVDIDQVFSSYITDPFQLLLRIIFVMVGISIGEEIIFRGYLQRLFESQLSFWKASTCTAILFGLLHFFLFTSYTQDTLQTMIAISASATIFGFVFSYAYKITGRNLFVPIIMHGVWDIIIFFFNTEFIYSSYDLVFFEILSQACAAIIFLVGLFYLKKYYTPEKELPDWNN